MPRKPKPKTRPTGAKALEIRERRFEVQALRLRGMTLAKIAEALNINIDTACSDLAAVRAENRAAVTEVDQAKMLADALARLENVEKTAWAEYNKMDLTPGQRLRALDLVRVTVNDKLKTLMDVGLVAKADATAKVTHVHELSWSPEMQERVARALLEQSLTTPLLEPVKDEWIDVAEVTEPVPVPVCTEDEQ